MGGQLRHAPFPLTALLAILGFALLLVPMAAGAHPGCTLPATGYASGGAPRSGFPDDPLYDRQWGLDQIKVPAAWQRGAMGQGAVIAVIDTGVDLAHPDLREQLVPGRDFTGGHDGCPPKPQDELGHGTEVAGVAAAAGNNGIGVVGVAPRARIMPLKVTDRPEIEDREFENIVQAVRYAADHGARVINLSFGGIDPFGDALTQSIQYAWEQGVVVVGAAGNSSAPACFHPGADPYVVCVAATDREGRPAFYSNFPLKADLSVAIRAPGGTTGTSCEREDDVWTTVWPGGSCRSSVRGYGSVVGTSFAAPHVAGVAALLVSKGLDNHQILDCLRTTSSNRGSYDPVFGYGIVDADAATATCSAG